MVQDRTGEQEIGNPWKLNSSSFLGGVWRRAILLPSSQTDLKTFRHIMNGSCQKFPRIRPELDSSPISLDVLFP
eukprot:scaffold204116_cov19-Tisochrysis_lutea.AAC.1